MGSVKGWGYGEGGSYTRASQSGSVVIDWLAADALCLAALGRVWRRFRVIYHVVFGSVLGNWAQTFTIMASDITSEVAQHRLVKLLFSTWFFATSVDDSVLLLSTGYELGLWILWSTRPCSVLFCNSRSAPAGSSVLRLIPFWPLTLLWRFRLTTNPL